AGPSSLAGRSPNARDLAINRMDAGHDAGRSWRWTGRAADRAAATNRGGRGSRRHAGPGTAAGPVHGADQPAYSALLGRAGGILRGLPERNGPERLSETRARRNCRIYGRKR